ncbi:MAG: hypothetical protein GF329_05090 [Candidatus Lokiarchaeota archaeon]|nr:hypothetical protein [Candidatus Lokiarchaeota archaeon]
MGKIDPQDDSDKEKEDLIDFLKSARGILLDGVKDAIKDKKMDNVRELYRLAGKISEELGDNINKEKYNSRMKLFEKETSGFMIENINLTIKSITQTIYYEIIDMIKKVLRVIESLMDANEVSIAEKIFIRQHAQLNFLLIQYIRKMRILKEQLSQIIPEDIISESFDEWKAKHKKLKLQIEKLKIKSELKALKYKK